MMCNRYKVGMLLKFIWDIYVSLSVAVKYST